MSFIRNWVRSMSCVPSRVFFLALVFAVASVYVSQEVSTSLAQTMPPPPAGDSGGMMPPPPGAGGSYQPPSGGSYQPPTGGSYQPPQGGSFQPPSGENGMMQPQQGGSYGYYKPQQDQGMYQPKPMGESNPQPMPGPQQQGMQPFGPKFDQMQNQKGMQQGMQPNNKGPEDTRWFGNDQGQGNDQGFNQDRGNGQGDQGFNQGQGNDQNDQMDAQRQKQMEQQFAREKKNFKQFANMLKKFGTQVAKLEKKGITVPADLKTTLETANTAITTILAAKSFEDDGVQDAMNSMQEAGQMLQEWGPKLGMLEQMPRMFKQAGNEIKKLQKKLASVSKMAARSKVDVTAQVADATAAVNEIVAAYQNAQQLAQNGDTDGAMEAIGNDVFEKMGDAYQSFGTIEAVQNISKSMGSFTRFITQAKRTIAKLEKKGEDVSEVRAQLDDMTARVAELKQAISQRVNDPDELRDMVDSIFELQNNIGQVTGGGLGPQMMGPQNGPSNNMFGNFNFSVFGMGGSGQDMQGPQGGPEMGPQGGF